MFVGADDFAQPSATRERYGCGIPLAGTVRPVCFLHTFVGADVGIGPYRVLCMNEIG